MSAPADISHPGEEGRASPHARYTNQIGTAADRLTDDLLVEILSRVPAKSLLRFRCVSSHWLALIDHPDHRKRLLQTPVGFFYSSNFQWFLKPPFHFTSFPGRRCPPIDASCSFLLNHERVHLLDCCNGLLLCRWCDASAHGDEFRYVVCNPATEKWVVLPSSGKATSEVATARLGFDPALSTHFHVFELIAEQDSIFPWDPDTAGVAVYSSETGRWVYKEERWSEQIRPIDPRSAFVFLNGYLHFQANARWLSHHLAVVDTQGETWMSFSVPGGLVDGFIQQSQGRLHYANFQSDGDGVIRLVVYVLYNYQSREWILKHSVEASYIFGGIDAYLYGGFGWIAMDFDWIAIHPECNMIFFTAGWDNTFMCYNMDLQQVKVISSLEDGRPPYLPYVPFYAELQSLHA